MAHNPAGSRKRLIASILGLSCLLLVTFAEDRAQGFTRTIEDIEDPSVTAKVLNLEVNATRSSSETRYCDLPFCPGPFFLSSLNSHHDLAGSTRGPLTADEFPRVLIDENDPSLVRITGDLVTETAEGEEKYEDFEGCRGSRTTTRSARLSVSLRDIYQSGSSKYEGLPGISLETQNLDPWIATCSPLSGYPNADQSSRTTKIEARPTPGPISSITPEEGCAPEYCAFSTTKDVCTPAYCDFTISAVNGYTGGVDASFSLTLRLTYPVDVQATVAPETRITKAPRRLVYTRSKSRKVVFGFSSTGPRGTRFKCRLDAGKFTPCPSNFKRKVRVGRHRLAVKSIYGGKADQTPAVYTWRVRKIGNSKR